MKNKNPVSNWLLAVLGVLEAEGALLRSRAADTALGVVLYCIGGLFAFVAAVMFFRGIYFWALPCYGIVSANFILGAIILFAGGAAFWYGKSVMKITKTKTS